MRSIEITPDHIRNPELMSMEISSAIVPTMSSMERRKVISVKTKLERCREELELVATEQSAAIDYYNELSYTYEQYAAEARQHNEILPAQQDPDSAALDAFPQLQHIPFRLWGQHLFGFAGRMTQLAKTARFFERIHLLASQASDTFAFRKEYRAALQAFLPPPYDDSDEPTTLEAQPESESKSGALQADEQMTSPENEEVRPDLPVESDNEGDDPPESDDEFPDTLEESEHDSEEEQQS